MVGRICPPGWNRVKVSENLGATAVALVAPVDTCLPYYKNIMKTLVHENRNALSEILLTHCDIFCAFSLFLKKQMGFQPDTVLQLQFLIR